MTSEEERELLTVRRRVAMKRLAAASERKKVGAASVEKQKIHSCDGVAAANGWLFCGRCGSYEEHKDDKCKRCGSPLYKYAARGDSVAE